MSKHPPVDEHTLLHAEGIVVERAGRRIVDELGLRLDPGLLLAIIGPNGAGKSTLLKSVLGLTRRQAGQVRVRCRAGALRCVDSMSMAERAACMAYVPQRSSLQAAISVEEVVAMGRFPHRGAGLRLRSHDLEAVARAMDQADVLPLAARRFPTLSGGEQARVLIARALATEAAVMLLDEPTASLDVGHAIDLLRLLRRLADAGLGIGIVLHDLNQAYEYCDHAILMHEGKGANCGPAKAVIRDRHIEQVYGVQLVTGGAFGFTRQEVG